MRLSFDVSEELRRRVRHEAVRRDMTLTELLTSAAVKVLDAGPGAGDDGCEVCGSFSHPDRACPNFDSRKERR